MAGETVIGALRYDFTADTSGLKSGLNEVTNSLKSVTDQVRQNTRQFKEQGEQASKSIGLAKHEMLNLTRQLTDAGVSLASGMSPFMVLIQQGGQVADVFQSTKASVGSALASILFSTKTAAIGIAAAIGTIAFAAYNAQASLEKLSETAKAVGSNRNALRDFGKQMSILGVDPEKVNEQLVGLAERLREAQLKGGDLAKQLDAIGININKFDLSKPGDFARLFEEIASKVRNGSSELDRLNAIKLLGLSEEFRRVFMDGREAISDFVRASQDAAEQSTKPLEDKWRNLRRIWSEVSQFISDTSATIVNNIIDFVTAAIQKIGSLIDWVKGKYAELANFRFADEKTIAGKGQGEGIADYEKRLGLQEKAKAVKLPDIAIGKEKQTDLAPMFQDFKSKAGGRSKGAKSGTDQVQSYIDGLREAAALAQAEADNWSKGNIEREKAMALVKAENIAKQEGRTLTAAQREEILALAGQEQVAKQKVDELKYSQDRLNDAMQEFGDLVSRSLEDLIIRGQKASEVLRQLISQLASSALRGMLTGEGAFGKLFGMAGDKEGGLGGILGKAISFLPKFADGGTLGAGRWGIAGEAGPELVKGPAHITPFGKMGGNQRAKVTVHNYGGAQVQTRQMSDGEILVLVNNMIQSNNKKVPGLVADAQRRSI